MAVQKTQPERKKSVFLSEIDGEITAPAAAGDVEAGMNCRD